MAKLLRDLPRATVRAGAADAAGITRPFVLDDWLSDECRQGRCVHRRAVDGREMSRTAGRCVWSALDAFQKTVALGHPLFRGRWMFDCFLLPCCSHHKATCPANLLCTCCITARLNRPHEETT